MRIPSLKESKELYIAGLALAAIAGHLVLRYGVDARPAVADVPLYVPVRSDQQEAGSTTSEGLPSGGLQTERRGVRVHPRWHDGGWSVVFVRALAGSRREIELAPGARVQLALGIWNGAARDVGAQKSITAWHELRVDP